MAHPKLRQVCLWCNLDNKILLLVLVTVSLLCVYISGKALSSINQRANFLSHSSERRRQLQQTQHQQPTKQLPVQNQATHSQPAPADHLQNSAKHYPDTKNEQPQNSTNYSPIKNPTINFEKVNERFRERAKIFEDGCRLFRSSLLSRPSETKSLAIGPFWPIMNTTLEYCFIQKSASDTWKTHLHGVMCAMNKIGIKNGTEANGKDNHGKDSTPLIRFTFVREPYSRLLSGYVDKLFSPNTMFWKGLGTYIALNFRQNATEKSLRCGHDVTFAEFVQYFVHSQETGQHRNRHFLPQYDHCGMCKLPYDYIGHLETMVEDMTYLLNVSQAPIQYTQDYSSYTVEKCATLVLHSGMPKHILECMSHEEATLRLWKTLQIRGVISKTEPYPFPPEHASTVSYETFVLYAQAALARTTATTSKEQLKRQKNEALREAFATVPIELRVKVREQLLPDFALFGYDPALPDAFSTQADNDDDFRYFEW